MTRRPRRYHFLAGLVLALISSSFPARAEKRVALLIGNGAYIKTAPLPNPKNDALAMADLLRKAGFDVVDVKTDLGADAMRRSLRDFSEQVRDADMALVFYAGHGMELNGVNYLIPVDATLARDVDVEDEAVSLDRVIRTLEPARRLQLVILDACRDNPFVRSMRRTFVSRSVRSGHADIDERGLPPNTLIAYAQKTGLTAEDGDGRNSPYTTALLKHLTTPGLDVELALRRVRDEVLKTTHNRQEPFKYGSLGGAELPLVPGVVRPSDAAEAWAAVKDTKSMDVLDAFAERYKDTIYAELARVRRRDLEALQKRALAAANLEAARLAALEKQQEEMRRHEESKQGVAAVPPPVNRPLLPNLIDKTLGIVLPPPTAHCDGVEITVGQAARRCFKPGAGNTEWFKDCPECPEMVVVPAGSFTMGSSANEPERSKYEAQVQVSIAAPFAVGRFAVTFEEWDACVAEGGCNGYRPADEGWGRGKHPVIHVSWDDAKAFASWVSGKTGKTYRLLSEAEREYATRSGTTTPFWWGSSISNAQANYGGTFIPNGDSIGHTVPVDTFAPNPWGLYQVHGNVWEWTEDCWSDSNVGNPGNGGPRSTGECERRVVRGGSWKDTPQSLRAASRLGDPYGFHMNFEGFRLARALAQ